MPPAPTSAHRHDRRHERAHRRLALVQERRGDSVGIRPKLDRVGRADWLTSASRGCDGGLLAEAVLPASLRCVGEVSVMRCERCRAEATSTGPGGQRLCDKHYNPIMAAAPGMVGTGTTADAFGAMVIAGGVASQVHGGHVPVSRRRRFWQRLRRTSGH